MLKIILADKIEKSLIESASDGDGYRLVLFTCGCQHMCRGCQNPTTWDISNGVSYDIDDVVDFLSLKFKDGYYDGLTISGGDPLYQKDSLSKLLSLLKSKISHLNIWVYTGYLYEEIADYDCLHYISVLVDGKFKIDEITQKKKFRGSANQRIIHLKNNVITEIE